MSRRAPPASRGIVPVHVELPESVFTKPVRQDPNTGFLSISDCVQNVSSGYEAATRLVARYFHADAIEVTMTNIGFEPSDVSYVRWAGARGSNDSIVAPLNVAMAFLSTSLETRSVCASGTDCLTDAQLTPASGRRRGEGHRCRWTR